MKRRHRVEIALGTAVVLAACSAPSTEPSPPSGGRSVETPAATAGGGGAGDRGPDRSAPGDEGAPQPGSSANVRDARIAFHLVDAPAEEASQIVVTIDRLDASIGGAWTTLLDTAATVDLLTLQGGEFLPLGLAALPAGHVDQLRLHLAEGGDHHVVDLDGLSHPLEVPSGEESGIKLVGGFDVPACTSGTVTIDFDGKRSLRVHPQGKSEAWSLRPVVKIKAVVLEGTCDAPVEDAPADPPETDACADVACADSELCENGICRAAE